LRKLSLLVSHFLAITHEISARQNEIARQFLLTTRLLCSNLSENLERDQDSPSLDTPEFD
jgi:hypothetical protein